MIVLLAVQSVYNGLVVLYESRQPTEVLLFQSLYP